MHNTAPTAAPRVITGNLVTVISVFLWSTGFPATALLLENWDPIPLAAIRMSIAAITLTLLVGISGRGKELLQVSWRDAFLFGGCLLSLSTTCLITAQNYADPTSVAIISTGVPVVSLFIGYLAGSEDLGTRKIIAIAFAIAGGITSAMAGITGTGDFRGGEIIILGSLVMFTIFTRNTVSRFQNVSDLTKGAVTTTAAALVLTAVIGSLWGSGLVSFRYDLNTRDLGLMLWIGSISAGISMVLWFMGGRLLGVTIAAMHQNAVPFHVMLVMFLLGGGFLFDRLIAAGMVIFGVILAQMTIGKRHRKV